MSNNKVSRAPSSRAGETGTPLRTDENKPVVSDALAKNSRQLLYAHLYNYLIENKLYDTAKILLDEADIPLSASKDVSSGTQKEPNLELGDLPDVKMLMTSPDTFLLEW